MEAVRISGDLQYLLAADAVWTEHAKRNTSEEIEDLGVLVDEMDAILGRLSRQGEFLTRIAREIGEDGFQAILSDPRAGEMAARMRERASGDGGLLSMIEKLLVGMGDTLSREQTSLRAECERVRSGHQSAGDVGEQAACVIYAAEAIVGALLIPVGYWLALGGAAGLVQC